MQRTKAKSTEIIINLLRSLCSSLPSKYRSCYEAFWKSQLIIPYIENPKYYYFSQYFELRDCNIFIKSPIYISIKKVNEYLFNNVLDVSLITFNAKDFSYDNTSKGIVRKMVLSAFSKFDGFEYPVCSIYWPVVSGKKYCVIDGNHRIFKSVKNGELCTVTHISTLYLPKDVFMRTIDWLQYLMVVTYYQTLDSQFDETHRKILADYMEQYRVVSLVR